MLKKIILIFVPLIFVLIVTAKGGEPSTNPFPSNNITINLFGDATILSLNYERLQFFGRKQFIAVNVGGGYSQSLGLKSKSAALLTVPMRLTYNICVYGRRQYVEFGLGATPMFYEDLIYWDYALYPIVGFRIQPYKKMKITMRLFVSYPLTDKLDMHNYWFSPIGFSIGYNF